MSVGEISTAAVEARLPNLWKTCWEVPAELVVPGLPESGCFLINSFFSTTWESVYRFSAKGLCTIFPPLSPVCVDPLVRLLWKTSSAPRLPWVSQPCSRIDQQGSKQLIHSDFSPAPGAA